MNYLDKDIAYLIKRKIRDSLTVCRFNQVCRTANLHQVQTLPNGEKHGLWKYYYNNGHFWYEGTHKDGKRHGLWKWYLQNGQRHTKGTYRDGLKHGLWKYYYISGHLWYKGSYRDGKYSGLWQWYFKNGQISNEILHSY